MITTGNREIRGGSEQEEESWIRGRGQKPPVSVSQQDETTCIRRAGEKRNRRRSVKMAKLPSITILIALCIFATLAGAEETTFVVEGKVYCDTCRAGFETTVTNYIPGAKVRLECRDRSTHEVLHGADGVTDAEGAYRIEVAGNREDEICEVRLVSSPDEGCAEVRPGRDRARVAVTDNSGIASNVRYANSLGFFKRDPLAICGPLLAQYHLADED